MLTDYGTGKLPQTIKPNLPIRKHKPAALFIFNACQINMKKCSETNDEKLSGPCRKCNETGSTSVVNHKNDTGSHQRECTFCHHNHEEFRQHWNRVGVAWKLAADWIKSWTLYQWGRGENTLTGLSAGVRPGCDISLRIVNVTLWPKSNTALQIFFWVDFSCHEGSSETMV